MIYAIIGHPKSITTFYYTVLPNNTVLIELIHPRHKLLQESFLEDNWSNKVEERVHSANKYCIFYLIISAHQPSVNSWTPVRPRYLQSTAFLKMQWAKCLKFMFEHPNTMLTRFRLNALRSCLNVHIRSSQDTFFWIPIGNHNIHNTGTWEEGQILGLTQRKPKSFKTKVTKESPKLSINYSPNKRSNLINTTTFRKKRKPSSRPWSTSSVITKYQILINI